MTFASINLLCLMAIATAAPITGHHPGPWNAGWGFKSLPAMPTNMASYLFNKSVVGYFVANNTGLSNPEELQAETRLGVVGIGWNLYHSATTQPQSGGHLEDFELQQAAMLKKARPDVQVMLLRNTEVLSRFNKLLMLCPKKHFPTHHRCHYHRSSPPSGAVAVRR